MSQPEATAVANFLYSNSSKVTEKGVIKIYNDYGGLEAFTKRQLSHEMSELRDALIQCSQFPADLYRDIVVNTPKITRDNIKQLARSAHAYAAYDLFERFWSVDRNATMIALRSVHVHDAVYSKHWDGSWWEQLPTIHTAGCNGDDSKMEGHWTCKRKKLFHADVYLAAKKSIQADLTEAADPRVIETIQNEVFSLSEYSRQAYADGYFVRDDHWAKLADDKRSVLNAIVSNGLLPTAVAEQIVFAHKTASLRENVAQYTTDPDLLRVIWAGTKSASIREAVEDNPLFPGVE